MRLFKTYKVRWFEMVLMKLSLLSLGIFAGAQWPEVFVDIRSGLASFAGLALVFLFVTMRKQIFS